MIELTRNGQQQLLPDTESEEAMRLFWQAKEAGDETASIRTVEASPSPSAEPPPRAAVSPSTEPPRPARPSIPEVSRIAKARIQLQESWLKEAGFDLAPPLFAPGTRVLPVGENNFRLVRRRVEALPTFSDAADQVVHEISAEERHDVTLNLKGLRMKPDGRLALGDEGMGLEARAFAQLASLGGFACGSRFLTQMCPARIRAECVNHQFERVHRRKQVVLRTRVVEGRRRVFAAVTPTYAVVDTDEILNHVRKDLDGARAELAYDGASMKATALFMPDEIVDLAAGDVFKVGVRLFTEDTGSGRIRIAAVAFRNRCLNLIVIGEGVLETVSQVHRGSPDRILEVVRTGVQEAREKIGSFLEAWGYARTVVVEPETQFRTWLRKGRIKLPGREPRDQTLQALMEAWHREPGNTLADAVNAVTRAAHETPGWTQEVTDTLQRQAAELVLVPA